MQVIHTDKEGGFIDLSKRTIQMADIEETKKYFEKSKIVNLIMKLTARTLGVKVIEVYESFGFDLYDHFEHAFDSFKLALT